MNKIFKLSAFFALCLMMVGVTSCQEELVSTDQYQETGVILNSYGPQPVLRGGTLRFLGTNLDKVTEVILPGGVSVTEITVVKAGVPSEIQITVPVEGPEPGLITLKTADGQEIVTKTELTYSEPIVIESFSPASAKADDILTIKGDYFNLIHEVIFSDKVYVSEKDFLKHTRYEIQVKVPVEARTGKIALGDLDELNNEDPNLMANTIFTETELVVAQPEVKNMTAPRFKVGETVTVTGKNFQYVQTVKLPGKDITDFTVASDKASLTFVLPAEAKDGEAYLIAKSGVEVLAGKYETVVPTTLKALPSPVKAGAVLTVSGEDLDVVNTVTLPSSGAAQFTYSDGDITLTVPDTATEGDILFTMVNGKEVKTAYTLVKPEVTEYSANPASAGSEMTIKGTDLDLVKSVTFGGDLTVEVEATAEAITVAVPTTAETGVLKLNLANGTSIECDELKVDKPVACYITELPGADEEINGGQVLIVPVANEDKLTDVQVNGEDVNFLLNGTDLYITIPRMAKGGTIIKLISSNGAVEYVVDCIPATLTNTVIWTGEFNAANWQGMQDLAWGGYDWSSIDLSVGTQSLVFEVSLNDWGENWWQMELRHGQDWAQLPEPVHVDFTAGQTEVIVPLTQTMLDDLKANGGLVITGKEFTLTKVTLRTEISLETAIWDKGFVISGWNGCQDLAWGGYDWSSVKPGQKLRFYCTPNDPAASWWCISLRVGDGWGALAGVPGQYDNPSVQEVVLTEEIINDLVARNGLVVTGDGCTLTKITIE